MRGGGGGDRYPVVGRFTLCAQYVGGVVQGHCPAAPLTQAPPRINISVHIINQTSTSPPNPRVSKQSRNTTNSAVGESKRNIAWLQHNESARHKNVTQCVSLYDRVEWFALYAIFEIGHIAGDQAHFGSSIPKNKSASFLYRALKNEYFFNVCRYLPFTAKNNRQKENLVIIIFFLNG